MHYSRSVLVSLVILTSCTMPRDRRKLKKVTKDWCHYPVFLKCYADNPFGSMSLTLYKNKKFNLTSSGFFTISYYAGSWEERYYQAQFCKFGYEETGKQFAVLNKDTYSICLYGTDTIRMGLLK